MHISSPPPEELERDDYRRFQYCEGLVQNKDVLDFGCGYGGFLDYCAGVAKSVQGVDLEQHRTCFVRYLNELGDKKFDVITAFHVIEHLQNPVEELRKLKERLRPNGKLIIEVPNSDDALLTLYNNLDFANFTYWSCHLYLFNSTTLRRLINQAGIGVEYIEHIQRYPLSNHLYWLSNGKPGGHKVWPFIPSKEYESALAAIGKTDTIIARCYGTA